MKNYWYDRARSTLYGARQSMVQDLYGYVSIFLTYTENPSAQEIEQHAHMLFEQ